LKLQKRFNRKVGDVEYSKFIVTLPKEQIEELHWHEGEELESVVERNKLVIKPHKVK
jgi:bifunctional DNA-binding transcriptional regulator/antitoxin component of YhaV-PrlF toxin-antitoxin module